MIPPPSGNPTGLIRNYLAEQETLPYPTVNISTNTEANIQKAEQITPAAPQAKKPKVIREVIIALIVVMALALYFVWKPANSSTATTTPIIVQQSTPRAVNSVSSRVIATSTADITANTDGSIQVYIVGAVKHPGVYTLSASARVYQLLQTAGGPLPNADLTTLNLASKLSDGQEVYVTRTGETPPAETGVVTAQTNSTGSSSGSNNNKNTGSVNINTASATDMQQSLHISSKTAQTIINYRLQHGPFRSINDLAQVVSKTIYNKIKGMVSV